KIASPSDRSCLSVRSQAARSCCPSAADRQRALTWAQRLKRVIASIEDPAVSVISEVLEQAERAILALP
ncbi:MAG TPA: hypothetical protein VLD39_16100, partial [Gammaproteobacteria bacterium]|nr:hypothetical protein [Gammaproteobacteria bacterium]